MAQLVLGPMLRHAGERDATIWVETDEPCEVEILGRQARTFQVFGHHYALVVLDDLEPGEHAYEVALDGCRRWPDPVSRFPPSTIRLLEPARGLQVAFGSCRVAAPHVAPDMPGPRRQGRDLHVDALHDLALRLASDPKGQRPDILLLLGDQVYADELSPQMLERIRRTRGLDGEHGPEAMSFEEYTWLYHESWSDPAIRWLLSTISSAMIFDDHDVHDDWNTSEAWSRETKSQPWWGERVAGAFMSYWLYQHLGNLSLSELREDALYAAASAGGDLGEKLVAFAREADRSPASARWSYRRDLGRVRLVVVDSRAGRVLEGGRRSMLDEAEWDWLDAQLGGDVDHLLVGTSLPLLLLPAVHHAEAWNEAVCAGAWGARAGRIGERIRRGLDLEHWAAFRASFERLVGMLREVAAGERGRPPATVVVLSGDVHHTYLAKLDAGEPRDDASAIYQAVCSPLRNPLERQQRIAFRVAAMRPLAWALARLAAAAGVPAPSVQWRVTSGPSFANQISLLELAGRSASLRVERPGGRALRVALT